MSKNQFTAIYLRTKTYTVAWIKEIPGVNTQGVTLNEARDNLREAFSLAVDENNKLIPKNDPISITSEFVERRIYMIRGLKVMLDADLADLYEVDTRNLNRAIRRNSNRFPNDFMFQLTKKEFENLMFQFGTSSWGGTRKLPYVFTELGVAMLSSVLNSDRAIQMNIFIMRSFVVKIREMLSTHKDLADKIEELERKQKSQGKNIDAVNLIIKELMAEPEISDTSLVPSQKIGFNAE